MNKLIMITLFVLFLAGCASDDGFDPKTNVNLINSQSFPELPDIEPVDPPNLIAWQADVPRDTAVLSVKNTTECRSVGTYEDPSYPGVVLPDMEQTDAWWARCGENPILPNSNIFIGFDQENWNIIQENFAKLRETLFRYKQRIDQVNQQRQEWRDLANESRNQ